MPESRTSTRTAVRILRRNDRQLARAIVHGAHCLDRVHDQVEQHLLQLHSISPYLRQRAVQLCLEHDVVAAQLLLGQGEHFAESRG